MEIEKIALKIAERHYSSKPNAEVDESYRLKMIENLKVQITDEFKEAQALQLRENAVSGCYVGTQTPIERLRNKLTPFLTLIDLLERNDDMVLPFLNDDAKNDLFESCLDTCIKYKQDIKTHLSDCEVFYNNH